MARYLLDPATEDEIQALARTAPPLTADVAIQIARMLRWNEREDSNGCDPPGSMGGANSLHDLRHGAATIALDAGIDIKVVSDQLGHTTTTLTRDTYQSVTKELHHNAAGAVAERIRSKRGQAV